MAPAIKSEFRKLFSIRTTYVWILLAYALLLFMSFYGEGIKSGKELTAGPGGALYLAGSITNHAAVLSVAAGVIALLFMTHEYRYNTIIYTLTQSNSRHKVLASKLLTIMLFVALFTSFGVLIGFIGMIVGLHTGGHSLPHQDLSVLTYLGKTLFYSVSFALTGLLLATLLRNQIAAFVLLFVIPNTAELLLSIILKHNTVYLPFTALQQVITSPTLPGDQTGIPNTGSLTPMKAVVVFSAYMLVGWIVTWIVFLKRDAN